jgi:hypothetical protein
MSVQLGRLVVARSRMTSSRAAVSSAASAVMPGRSGTDTDSASSASSFATRHIWVIIGNLPNEGELLTRLFL